MKMFVEYMCAGTYPDETTEQAFEKFDYLANLTNDWVYTGSQNNVIKPSTAMPT